MSERPWWNNTETWTTREGETMRLEDMEPGHRENVIRWIYRHQRLIRMGMELYYIEGSLLMNGEMASESLEQMAHEVQHTPTEDLIESLPLVKRLRELNRPRIFSSKTPRDLNHDPYPNVWDGHTPFNQMRADHDKFRKGAPVGVFPTMTYLHRPRPEFDHAQHNEPNALLVTFRTIWKGHPGTIQGYLAGITAAVAEDDEPQLIARVEHARRVLSRLATLTEGSNA